MKRRLYYLIAALALSLTASAQEWLYVCHGDSCEIYETARTGSLSTDGEVLRIDYHSPYSVHRIDSMVFTRPVALAAEERGWRGSMEEGGLRLKAVLNDSAWHFDYRVHFATSVRDSICHEDTLELTFGEAWHANEFVYCQGYEYNADSTAVELKSSPYTYVRNTLTGPRKFAIDRKDDGSCILLCDDPEYLAGRTTREARQAIDDWLYRLSGQ